MRAIVPDVAHALFGAVFLFTSLLIADTHTDVIDVCAGMAAALSDHNVSAFMKNFDKDMPAYDTLKNQIQALMTGADLTSSIEPIKDDGDEAKRTADFDWYLQIRSQYPTGPIVNRREIIHCELRKQGKHWKVVSLQPMEFFAPPPLDK